MMRPCSYCDSDYCRGNCEAYYEAKGITPPRPMTLFEIDTALNNLSRNFLGQIPPNSNIHNCADLFEKLKEYLGKADPVVLMDTK